MYLLIVTGVLPIILVLIIGMLYKKTKKNKNKNIDKKIDKNINLFYFFDNNHDQYKQVDKTQSIFYYNNTIPSFTAKIEKYKLKNNKIRQNIYNLEKTNFDLT